MTSMEQELGERVGMGAVKECLRIHFAERFGLSFSPPLGEVLAVGHLKR
jgi:hypothetical protein